ncbi:iron-containing alcohol dehydrogenase [Aliiglaciecola sp.]|nr:iron-containing alcohol dehydrogenase [Aliiglaciecola sp.]
MAFEFSTTPKIVYAQPLADVLKSHCDKLALTSLCIVTDQQILSLGLLDPVIESLHRASIKVTVFAETESDPSVKTVKQAAEFLLANNVGFVVGIGGGSAMDVAKVASILAAPNCHQTLEQLFGIEQVKGLRLPLVLVPTTAGTGSEVTPISIITTGETTKAGIVSNSLLPDIAILDPALTLGLPPSITAATGIDAMVHAIEAYTSKIKKNPLSDHLSCNALKLLSNNIRMAVHDGKNLNARGEMLLGSMLAGQAFANAPVGGVHALAYPLGGTFHIPHGLSNALMLPHVMRFNLPYAKDMYAELAQLICPELDCKLLSVDKAETLVRYLQKLISELGLPARLREVGITQDSLANLAKQAMLQQRLLVNNPVEITEEDALMLYQQAF